MRRPSPIKISGLALSWATAMGVEPAALAEASGVSREALESGVLDYEDALAMWDGLERLTGDPHVGLHAGERFRLDQMGMVGPAMAHAATVGAMLDGLERILPLLVRGVTFERVGGAADGGLSYRTPQKRSRHGPDAIFAAIVSVARAGAGRRIVPAKVELEVEGPGDPSVHVAFYGTAPTWGAPANTLRFRAEDLAAPMAGAAPALAGLLLDHAPTLIAKDGGQSVFDVELERAFWKAQAAGGATLESTAEVLRVSPRTLQRRLEERGVSFQAHRAALLAARADELLDDHALSIDLVAERLGYRTRTSFERAYERWRGTSPARARADRRK